MKTPAGCSREMAEKIIHLLLNDPGVGDRPLAEMADKNFGHTPASIVVCKGCGGPLQHRSDRQFCSMPCYHVWQKGRRQS